MSKEIKKKPEERIDWMDVQTLAGAMLGFPEEDDRGMIEDALYAKFDISLEQFEKVIDGLWPLLEFGLSSLTNTPFVGFANKEDQAWIIKKEVTKQFVASVIQWCGGDEIKGNKGMVREVNRITPDGTTAYEITITKP